jgi:hypothetical protein
MHRFVWDLSSTTLDSESAQPVDDEDYGAPSASVVIPGTYKITLTVDGIRMTQTLKVVMDPRSPATPAELEQQYKLGRQMFAEAMAIRQTLADIRSVRARLTAAGQTPGDQSTPSKAEMSQLDDAIKTILEGSGARLGDGMGLEVASGNIASALRVVESGDRTVPAQAMAVFEEAERAAKLRMDEWNHLMAIRLRSFAIH